MISGDTSDSFADSERTRFGGFLSEFLGQSEAENQFVEFEVYTELSEAFTDKRKAPIRSFSVKEATMAD